MDHLWSWVTVSSSVLQGKQEMTPQAALRILGEMVHENLSLSWSETNKLQSVLFHLHLRLTVIILIGTLVVL